MVLVAVIMVVIMIVYVALVVVGRFRVFGVVFEGVA
jgi:hypothetical protein